MNEFISRKALLDAMPKNDELSSLDVRKVICSMPAADVAFVRHGQWIPCGNDPFDAGMFYCSVCQGLKYFDEEVLTSEEAEKYAHYCSNCGAKMNLKE